MWARRDALVAVGLAVLTAIVFLPAVGYDFVVYDDPEYVTENAAVRRGLGSAGVAWAFAAAHAANWHPFTWLSHMLDVTLFGLAPAGHHLTNVLLHALAAGLCHLALVAITGAPGRSLAVAALFALHPLRVESVAWVSERKDVLAAVCWMLTLLAWCRFVARPTGARYASVLAAFGAGLLAKPMVVTLPAVLVLLDWWPLRRPIARERLVEKLPLFGLAAAASVVTFVAQRSAGAMATVESLPLARRVAGAIVGYATYLGDTIWPAGLAVFYPPHPLAPATVAAAAALLAACTVAAVALRHRTPAALVGWLWYLGVLVPVIGLVKVGDQATADRFTYLPHVGLFLAAVWVVADTIRSPRARTALGVLAAAGCALVTRGQLPVWRDSLALFTHALAVTRDNPIAELNLAATLLERERAADARPHAARALALWPDHPKVHLTAGATALALGDAAAALAHFEEAARRDPTNARARYDVGLAYAALGRSADAVAAYREAIRLDPTHVKAHASLGLALADGGRLDEAIAIYRAGLAIDPTHAPTHANLAIALETAGRREEAIAAYRAAIRLAPDRAMLWYNLGGALVAAGAPDAGRDAYREAIRRAPDWRPPQERIAELDATAR